MNRRQTLTLLVPASMVTIWFVATHLDPEIPRPADKSINRTTPPSSRTPSWQATAANARTAESLASLKSTLLAMPSNEAIASIEKFLNSNTDHRTDLNFEIGQANTLTGWPTLRTFLIDLLLEIDPAAAARISRNLLATPSTADEWALAMRNVARSSGKNEDTALLQQKSREMLANSTWRANPSIGYLQAFDVIVHTRDIALTPDLLSTCEERSNPAVRHAAFLTLDRLTLADPTPAFHALLEHATDHPEISLMVSNLIARADLRDSAQKQLVEAYLLAPERSDKELQSFAGIFPNANQMISHNLLTQRPAADHADLAAQDQSSLAAVAAWIDDPRFSRSRPWLQEAIKRIRTFSQP